MRLNNHKNTAQDYQTARLLRNNASPVEQRLWRVLSKNAAAHGLKFRRQQAIHPYIVDFACLTARLIIELDGTTHDNQQAYDAKRTAFLEAEGYQVLRFTNEAVMQNPEGVVATILDSAQKRMSVSLEGSVK